MSYIRFVTLLMLIFVITACGRRLPDEYFDTTSDFPDVTSETVEVVTADETDSEDMDETEQTDAEEAMETDQETADEQSDSEAETEEDSGESADTQSDGSDTAETNEDEVEDTPEPQFELVEVPADPIVEQVANADPVNGEALMSSGVPCTSCHRFDSEEQLVGPGLLNIPQRAENRVEDVIAERYLYESISHPNDYVVDGFGENIMPQTYGNDLSEQDILDMVAYLMTLGDYPEREPVFIEVPVESSADDTEAVGESDGEEVADADDTAEVEADETSDADEEETETEDADDTEDVAETTDDDAETDTSEDETDAMLPDLDLSGVPATVDILAEHGSVVIGEAIFATPLIDETSCASCHASEDPLNTPSPAYVWAAILSTEVHGDLGTQYSNSLTSAEMSHLVAYLMSLNETASVDD